MGRLSHKPVVWYDDFLYQAASWKASLVKHARYYWVMLAESHLTRRLSGSMVGRDGALAVATG